MLVFGGEGSLQFLDFGNDDLVLLFELFHLMFEVLILSLQVLQLFLVLLGNSLPHHGHFLFQLDLKIAFALVAPTPEGLQQGIFVVDVSLKFLFLVPEDLVFLF